MATIETDFPAALRWMDWNAGLPGAASLALFLAGRRPDGPAPIIPTANEWSEHFAKASDRCRGDLQRLDPAYRRSLYPRRIQSGRYLDPDRLAAGRLWRPSHHAGRHYAGLSIIGAHRRRPAARGSRHLCADPAADLAGDHRDRRAWVCRHGTLRRWLRTVGWRSVHWRRPTAAHPARPILRGGQLSMVLDPRPAAPAEKHGRQYPHRGESGRAAR